ncbi:hypothetical protein LJC23_03350 [Desulfovibrio sp. OttesenSCG-928-I05]|nr:hypothetical protein [Desulfovibrio sp. OttesenSCG-928-I05]
MIFGLPDDTPSGWMLGMFESLTERGPVCDYAPKAHYYRPLYEKFVKFGMMRQGRDIPAAACLSGLTTQEVRYVAGVLGVGKGQNKAELIAQIKLLPDERIRAAMRPLRSSMDDLFYAEPMKTEG